MTSSTSALDVLRNLLPIILPIIVLQLAMQVAAIVDLVRRDKVRGGNKWIWGAVIVLGEMLGPVVYFLVGRVE